MRKLFVMALAMVWVFACLPEEALSQASPSAEEYAMYEKANAETDAAKKQAIILEFVQKYPGSSLDPNMAYMYTQYYQSYRQSGNWQTLATAAEKYLQYRPSDTASIAAATEAYQKLGNTQKLVNFGTKLYSQHPNANTAYFVAKAYKSLNDGPNFQKWADTTLKHDPNNMDMLYELTVVSWQSQNMPQTATYGQRMIKAADAAKKPDSQPEDQWTTKMNELKSFAYGAIGEASYRSNDYATANKNFDAAVKLNKRNDHAHYRLGFINWQAGRTDVALMSFAKAFVLGGPAANDAKTQLNALYKQRYNNTNGVPALIEQARAAMR